MEVADVIVVGGGMAGLSAALSLMREGVGRVRLLEREEALCVHSSGRNAAIFRQVATTDGDFELGRRSRELLNALLGSEEAWLRRTGNWFVAIAAREGAEGATPIAAIPRRAGARLA